MANGQSDNHQLDDPLQAALADARRRQAQMSALLAAARAVLDYREFGTAARFVYESCKHAVGAGAGYVALLSEDGTRNEVLFLDAGGIDCTVDPSLPMPIRGLRQEAYVRGRTVYENSFLASPWHALLPPGHVDLNNVLFSPLLVDGHTVGVLGLANKPGGFTEDDAGLATAFGELCALALLNSRALESLQESEERFRTVAQTAHDAIITIDSRGEIVFWNRAAEEIFGYSADEVTGKPLATIMPERFRLAHQDGVHRVVSTGEARLLQQTVEMVGLGKGRGEFPVELSLASWRLGGEVYFSGIVRDISGRVQAEEEIRSLARFPGENRNPVLRISRDGTILYANQASAPLLAAWDARAGDLIPAAWRAIVAGVAHSGGGPTIELSCRDRIFSIDVVPVEGAPYVNLYGRDVTDRRRAEAALQRERDFSSAVLNTAGALVIVLDREGRIVQFNRACERLTGYPFEEVEGQYFWDLFLVPEEVDAVKGVFAELRAGAFPNEHQNYWLTRQGERRLIAWSNTALFDGSGAVEYIVGTGIDVTVRRQAEDALRRAHDELEQRVQERTAELARANRELRAEIEERVRVEDALRVQSAIAKSLSDASTALTRTLDLDTVLNTLLDYLGGLVPYDRATVLLPRDEGAQFAIRAVRSSAAQDGVLMPEKATVDAADLPLLRALIDAQDGVLVSDARGQPGWNDPHFTVPPDSWLGVPLRNDGKVIGACLLGKAEARFYTSQHLQLAEALVSQASVAVQNAWLFDQVRAGQERLRSLSRRLVEIQETERRYVARELHDEASQALASLMVGLRLLEQDAERPEAVVAGVSTLKQLVDSVIEDLHRLAMDLRPASLDHLGLVAALRQYVETTRDQHRLQVQYEVVGLDARLPPDVETAVYRVVQEAVTNVIHHARATRLDVLLERRGSQLIVLVEDDGIGFDPAAAAQSGRLGLFGMHERTEMLGGKLVVESVPNGGTTVLMEVPYVD
jgi:PAS domain S-box-containing protein